MRSTLTIYALKETEECSRVVITSLKQAGDKNPAFKATVTFITENSFDLSLISANSDAD